MKSNRFYLNVCIASCFALCVLFVPILAQEDAFAAGAENDSPASQKSDVSSADKAGSPLGWFFDFLFGKSSDSASESGSSTTTGLPSIESSSLSSVFQPASETASDPLSGSVESAADAVNRIHDCLMRAGKEVPPKIEFDHMSDSGRYVIHGYEIVNNGNGMSHQATWFWYSVGKDGSIYDEILMCNIDPKTMEKEGQMKAASNRYYEVALPPELSGAEITYEEGRFGGPTTAGAITGVVMNGRLQFEVVCLSDDWGPQGDMVSIRIGSPSFDSSSVVYLTVPLGPVDGVERDRDAAEAKARKYATYVTLL